jgi:hypothetical protein
LQQELQRDGRLEDYRFLLALRLAESNHFVEARGQRLAIPGAENRDHCSADSYLRRERAVVSDKDIKDFLERAITDWAVAWKKDPRTYSPTVLIHTIMVMFKKWGILKDGK